MLVAAFALLALGFLIVLAPLAFATALKYAPWLALQEQQFTYTRYAIAGTVIVIALVVAHKWLPGGRRRFVDIAPGVIVTLVLWLAGGILFGRYLAEFATNYVTMYAGLASAMIALVFLYCDRDDLRLWRRAQRRDPARSARARTPPRRPRAAAAAERAALARQAPVPEDDAAAGLREAQAVNVRRPRESGYPRRTVPTSRA